MKQEGNYLLGNIHTFCKNIWPEDTWGQMDTQVGVSNTFWMTLPKVLGEVPAELLTSVHWANSTP